MGTPVWLFIRRLIHNELHAEFEKKLNMLGKGITIAHDQLSLVQIEYQNLMLEY